MTKDQMYELLLQCWTVAYEKAIVDQEGTMAKTTIDKASCEAVEDLTKRLLKAGSVTEEDTVGNRFDTMEDSIWHHIKNLEKGNMFNGDQKLEIKERSDYGENVVEITVKNCTYQAGCKWALEEEVDVFNPLQGLYRCQRLGCFVGAVKKYLREDKLADEKRQILDYLMTTVMKPTEEDQKEGIKCRCQGFIFINENLMEGELLKNNPPQFSTK